MNLRLLLSALIILASPAAHAAGLSYADVRLMLKMGFGSSATVEEVKSKGFSGPLKPDQEVVLANLGASPGLIATLKNPAFAAKPSATPARPASVTQPARPTYGLGKSDVEKMTQSPANATAPTAPKPPASDIQPPTERFVSNALGPEWKASSPPSSGGIAGTMYTRTVGGKPTPAGERLTLLTIHESLLKSKPGLEQAVREKTPALVQAKPEDYTKTVVWGGADDQIICWLPSDKQKDKLQTLIVRTKRQTDHMLVAILAIGGPTPDQFARMKYIELVSSLRVERM